MDDPMVFHAPDQVLPALFDQGFQDQLGLLYPADGGCNLFRVIGINGVEQRDQLMPDFVPGIFEGAVGTIFAE